MKYSAAFILGQIAKRDGTSIEQVKRKIEARIEEGLNNPDPDKRGQWKKIPCGFGVPTPEEYIDYVICKLKDAEALDLLNIYLDL